MDKGILNKYIVLSSIENVDNGFKHNNQKFTTLDRIFLDSYEEIEKYDDFYKFVSPSDYAIANEAFIWEMENSSSYKEKITAYWLRTPYANKQAYYVFGDEGEDPAVDDVFNIENSICPAMRLNVDEISAIKDKKISQVKNRTGNVIYHTIEFGEYPTIKASNSDELEEMFSQGRLQDTKKKYVGSYNSNEPTYNYEYTFRGKKYVRVELDNPIFDFDSVVYKFSDGSNVKNKAYWFEVMPIRWIIRNWDDMPTSINPNGNGMAKYIDVRSEDAIISGIPFFARFGMKNASLWQNSTIRAYLNGEKFCKENVGNPKFIIKNHKHGLESSFINEAFSCLERNLTMDDVKSQNGVAKNNPFGFNFAKLSNDDLLSYYIQTKTSIFLHGPSGVGKSERVKAIDPTATRITLRPQMNPEEIDGVLDRETGNYIPPYWYTILCEKCKTEPDKNHVLFIDELTNVKPTIQSMVYSIVLERAGKDGLWPLPENCVVVAAGNETSGNLAAYPLSNALFRRFCHLYYTVNKSEWLDWATGITKKADRISNTSNNNRAKIHPALVAFIMSRGETILSQELDEENPKIVTDPRKWEIASKVLYETNNPNALLPAIGEDLTYDFVAFLNSIKISASDVVNNKIKKQALSNMTKDEEYSTLLSLSLANENEIVEIRNFIGEYFGKIMLEKFDMIWVQGDNNRKKMIDEIIKNGNKSPKYKISEK